MNRDYGNRDFGRSFAPVKVGDELDVTIEAVGEKGDGIAKKEGFVLFVPNTSQGDNVKIKITKVLRKVGFAEVIGQGEAPAESEEAPAESAEESDAEEEAPAEEEQSDEAQEDTEDFGEDLEKKE
ncbi:TRAM domain-containing protein [Candidatus Woesearchaeota archaeon]|nr:TRAM domain-containing protein [Candidatus Woesearchaeota archaeon]